MGEFGSTGLQYPTVPIKKIKDTSSSDFHYENSIQKKEINLSFFSAHMYLTMHFHIYLLTFLGLQWQVEGSVKTF